MCVCVRVCVCACACVRVCVCVNRWLSQKAFKQIVSLMDATSEGVRKVLKHYGVDDDPSFNFDCFVPMDSLCPKSVCQEDNSTWGQYLEWKVVFVLSLLIAVCAVLWWQLPHTDPPTPVPPLPV